jgi:hypothetical protein
MAGSKEEDHSLHQSPRIRGIIQHFERQVQPHLEGLDNDMQVTNDKIGQLEATQIATNTKQLFCGVLMTSMQRPTNSMMIGRMDILLILNKMNKTLAIADSYALIIEVWVVFTDLKPYLGEDNKLESRMTQMQGEDDEDIATNDTFTPTPVPTSITPLGPITRARARQLTHQVSSLLSSGSSYLDNGDTCTLILLRNNGLDQKGRGIAQAGFGLQDKHDL